VYSFPTPNGLKASIALEGELLLLRHHRASLIGARLDTELKALGVDINYTLKTVDIPKGETRAEW
jgi:hypothetical protein